MKFEQISGLSKDRLELLATDLYQRLQQIEARRAEPIAIVGMACRFPGAPTVDEYWKLLAGGVDAIREVPPERMWDKAQFFDVNPDAPGKTYVWEGGFLDGIEGFDAKFFGISPREAKQMDPQQRLLLEMVWEALEHGGQSAARLGGSSTGMYVAISTNDFLQLGCRHGGVEDIDPYSGTGSAASIAAGRISYLLGFNGPNFPVDTACSSSLVALHLACQALRLGEIDAGIVAGVNLMLAPETTVYFSKIRALSLDGRCHTFDASANGYIRSEGAGAVVLKRLSDAIESRDNIMAVIRGTAVNHDGRTSGLTVPNGGSQERLIRQALKNAGLTPADIGYFEAHGTGTPLGDPIELQALGKIFNQSHSARDPLLIGSCKTNIGHTEAAAGIAGLIKVVLSLQHRRIPAHLHFHHPNPAIPWKQLPFEVPRETRDWPEGRPCRAGVSSFGFSGTNAHAVLEAAPTVDRAPASTPSSNLLCISGKTVDALRATAQQWSEQLQSGAAQIGDVCFTSSAGRSQFGRRAALTVVDRADAVKQLQGIVSGETPTAEVPTGASPNVAFLFTGQGAQFVGMGQELFGVQPTFRAALLEVEEALAPHMDRPLRAFMFIGDGADQELIRQTQYAQPALFAIEYALGKMWMHWGVRPAVMFGHSIGQYAAACLAGVFTLKDAARLVAHRARLMQNAPGSGTMIALRADLATAEQLVAPYRDRASIGAINAPQGIVISGCRTAIQAIVETCKQRRIASQELAVSHGFHSPMMQPIVEEFHRLVAETPLSPPRYGMLSDADGKLVREKMASPEYWSQQLVNPVQFVAGVQTLRERGYETFVEVGPSPTLITLARQSIDNPAVRWLPSFRPRTGEWDRVLETLRELYLAGVDVDWEAFHRDTPALRTPLPTYPFQRQKLLDLSAAEQKMRAAKLTKTAGPSRIVVESPMNDDVDVDVADQAAGWVFDVTWKPVPLPVADATSLERGSWLILSDSQGLGTAIAGRFRERGDRVYTVEATETSTLCATGVDRWQLDPTQPEHFRELLGAIAAEDQSCRGILHLWSLDAPTSSASGGDLLAAQRLSSQSVFHLVKALTTAATPGSPTLLLATRGVQAVLAGESSVAPQQATLWGLAKIVAVEHPHLRPIRVDLDSSADAGAEADSLLRVLAAQDHEDQVALRGGERYAARLRGRRDAFTEAAPIQFKADAAYLITGGLGGLGLMVAKWMVERGARRLALTGRSQPNEQALGALEDLRRCGADVHVLTGDVAEAADLARILTQAKAQLPPLAGIVHAAGVLADGPIVGLEWADFETVMRPKLLGTAHLLEQTRDLPLDFLVGFSSISSLLGSPHQSNYAAANAAMDAMLAQRAADGKPGLSLNWGPWSEAGMAARMGKQHLRSWSALGIGTIDTESGLALMDRLTMFRGGQLGLIPTDWTRFFQLFPPGLEPPLLKDLVRDHRKVAPPSKAWLEMVEALDTSPTADHPAIVGDYVEALVAEALGGAELGIDRRAGLFDLGMNSLSAIELRTQIQTDVGFSQILPVTFVFNLPTIDQMATFLLQQVLPRRLAQAADAPDEVMETAEVVEQLAAVIGPTADNEPAAIPVEPAAIVDDEAVNAAPSIDDSETSIPAPTPPVAAVAPARAAPSIPAPAAPKTTRNLNGSSMTAAAPEVVTPPAPSSRAVAVVGIGCRFPGGIDSPETFWRVLSEGIDCIREVPASRWDVDAWYDPDPEAVGKMNTRYGGFIDGVDEFDANYFGISPREAVRMDPQHRMLLETVVHALEHANHGVRELAGSDTGVFIGLSGNDYLGVLRAAEDPALVDGWLATGNALSIAAGRLSHYFDFNGPCMAVDTACSSSLLAVHLACEALISGKTSLALAGGVGLILGPEVTISLTKAHAMAPDGRCKTFDASANGYVRSEGCGIIVLKRLDDAVAAGDRILGIVRATAMNHDGHSSGVTVPNGAAQTRLLQSAVAAAGIAPDAVDYVEAHGTGTPLGDPIELQAVGKVYGSGRTADRPLRVGSVKTNIGHTEAAAGVAGLMKCLLALGHRQVPPHLHFRQPNPFIPWSELPVEIPRTCLPWPTTGRPRIAAVSSFGFSGTNVHAVVEEGPAFTERKGSAQAGGPHLLCLSGKSDDALREQARRIAELLARDGVSTADLCYTANAGRSHYDHRLTIQGDTAAQLRSALESYARNESSTSTRTAVVNIGKRAARVAFIFTDDAALHPNALRQLYAAHVTFRDAFNTFDVLLQQQGFESCLQLMLTATEGDERLHDPACTRPVNLAMQYALAELWKSWGVEAKGVAGSGAGEYLAAHWAGAFPLDETVSRIADRLRHHDAGGTAEAETNGTSAHLNAPSADRKRRNGSHGSVGLICSATGRLVAIDEARRPEFWSRRGAGHGLQRAIESLRQAKFDLLLQLGPESALITADDAAPASANASATAEHRLLDVLQALYLRGVPVRWKSLYRGRGRRWVELPGYPFQRRRYWPEVKPRTPATAASTAPAVATAPASDSNEHPVLGKHLKSPILRDDVFERCYTMESPSFVKDHRVHSMLVLPGASHLSTALSAAARNGEGPWELQDVAFPEAMIFNEGETRTAQIIIEPDDKGPTCGFRVMSQAPDNPDKWLLHSGGKLCTPAAKIAPPSAPPDLAEVQRRCDQSFNSAERFYEFMDRSGVTLGPTFRWNRSFWRTDGEGLSRLEQPAEVIDGDRYVLFPGLIDSCIQLIALAIPVNKRDNSAYIPVSVQSLRCYGPAQPKMWCHFKLQQAAVERDGVFLTDWLLFDDEGRVIAEAVGMRFQRAPRTALLAFARRRYRDWLYRLDWVPQPLVVDEGTSAAPNKLPVLVLADGSTLADSLAAALERSDVPAVVVDRATCAKADLNELLRSRLPVGCTTWREVLLLATGDDEQFTDDPTPEQLAAGGRTRDLLALVQALTKKGGTGALRTTLVTRGVQAVGESASRLRISESPLWGFARVLAIEFPQLRCRRIDLDAAATAEQDAANLVAELASESPEDQLAYRAGARHAARLLRGPSFSTAGGAAAIVGKQPYRLERSNRGVIEDLTFQPLSRMAPGIGEIEIVVHATGLNFRDVLNALNLYPGDPGPLGVECAGTVTAVGEGVTSFAVGDRVAALGPACFNEFTITDARLAAKLPDNMSFAEGASIPVVYLTAEYALRHLADLKAGETLLIHSAAGGVGHAALQIAKRLGANVIATAGNPQKREYLKQQGVEHVFDSRTLDFADDVLRVTEGKGVDVVLNFLPGAAIAKNLRALKPKGRFVEIGKIDIYDEKRMADERPDVKYDIVAIDTFAVYQPHLIETMFGPLMRDFADGTYRAMPVTEFEVHAVRDAFRFMAQGLHIGKVVVTHAEHAAGTAVSAQSYYTDRTWLITGGLGALGLACARHLASAGVRNLVLLGRSAPNERARHVLESLAEQNVNVVVKSTDVADRSAMETLFAEIDGTLPPLGGVLHLAGMLDDALIANLDWSRFETVMQPKILGAWNLHRLTRDRDLKAFVMFSSASSLIGSPGQANYAAANAYLDALAFARRSAGLPGLSINWGPWAEGGMATRTGSAHSQWELMGLNLLTPEDGLQVLQLLVDENATQSAVLPMDWKKVLGRYAAGSEPPVLSAMAGEQRVSAEPSKEWLALVDRVKEAPPAERVEVLMAHLQKEAGAVLGLDPSHKLNPHAPLNELGFDSLTAVELSNRFTSASGISLSLTLLFDYPTLHAMSTYMVRDVLKLDIGDAEDAASESAAPAEPQGVDELTSLLVESIGGMSDEDVQRRVSQLRAES